MANISHVVTVSWAENNAGLLQKAVTRTGQAENNLAFNLAGATTNESHAWAFTLAKLVSVVIFSDQDVTLKTNSSGSPQETIALKADVPFVWYKDGGVTAPFAGNVTGSYWTNAGATSANIYVKCLVESP